MAIAPARPELETVALTPAEYQAIVRLLGREPNDLELGMFGALWSEHCSYKTSRPVLAQLPTDGPGVLQGPGENAGIVDIGDGLAVVFKIESHNHPSAIEPYQGAATGVGGILRDIFTMGARPLAILDSLRFGSDDAVGRRVLEGVVAGIGGYGNCFGCPTVGGEMYFDAGYRDNPIVNAMCVGVVEHDRIRRARAERAGDRLLLVGADTGRDGIHGAAFASVQMNEQSHERRPAVQVGNPFLEKLLCEACLQLTELDGVVAIQDLGAAGLTGAACELAHRGGRGVELDVARVSRRERGMTPYEVMLSESQERMLVLVKPATEPAVRQIFKRFDLHADRVGTILNRPLVRVRDGSAVVAELPLFALIDRVPRRPLVVSGGDGAPPTQPSPAGWGGIPSTRAAHLLELLARPNLRNRRPIYRRYDHQVGNNTVIGPGSDAALVRVPGTRKGLALTTDGNAAFVALDPYTGTQLAVLEAARNIGCTGARPLAVTNCLNFGNPERPEVAWQLDQSVRGLADVCRALQLPVVSGNVSLYNETNGVSIPPTPVIGMVGLLDDLDRRCGAGFQGDGDLIFVLGETREELGGSEYSRMMGWTAAGGPAPLVDLEADRRLLRALADATERRVLRSAHDLAEGGLAVALAESVLFGGLGARCPELSGRVSPAALYFGESSGRVLVGVEPRRVPELQKIAIQHGVALQALGVVGGDQLVIGQSIRLPLDALRQAWEAPW